ncbi:hypothetical protein GCM10022409_45940 [Hymenobacter glaciei]|uniref:Lipoprotein n=1 Tax=Hymenobacter glaciei TaxID=877209 RepID=A0ABP7UVH2_9BACT
MKASPLYLFAALGLSLASCDPSSSKKGVVQNSNTATTDTGSGPAAAGAGAGSSAATKTTATAPAATKVSNVALPAGLKVGRWQAFLLTQQHAVHFVFEVVVEDNKAVAYLVNEGPQGQERLRCDKVRAIGDSATISLPGTDATLTVHANGDEHLAGAWAMPNGKTSTRIAFSALYGELSPLRLDATTPNFAGTWRVTFKDGSGKTHAATLVCEQKGAKLFGSLDAPGSSYRYLSGAALASGLGLSSFDGRTGVLLQAQKLANGTLRGNFYSGKSRHETWTAVPAQQADFPKD